MVRVPDSINAFDGLSSDSLIDKAQAFLKSDTGAKVIDAVKGYVLPKKATTPAIAPGVPYTVAPTQINWTGVVLPVVGGVLGLSILAWALLRK